MPRQLDTDLLDKAARHYAAEWLRPSRKSTSGTDRWIAGREYVLQDLYNFTYKDVFEYVLGKVKANLGPEALKDFEAEAAKRFTPRSNEVFAGLLKEKLAIDPDGKHVPGVVGTVEVARRDVGELRTRRGIVKRATWPVYAGEDEERAANSEAVDPLPPPGKIFFDVEHLQPVPDGGWDAERKKAS